MTFMEVMQWAVLLWNIGKLLYYCTKVSSPAPVYKTSGGVVTWGDVLPVVAQCLIIMVLSAAGCFNRIFH